MQHSASWFYRWSRHVVWTSDTHLWHTMLHGVEQITWTNGRNIRYLEKGLASVVRRWEMVRTCPMGTTGKLRLGVSSFRSLHQEVADVFLYLIRLSHKVGLWPLAKHSKSVRDVLNSLSHFIKCSDICSIAHRSIANLLNVAPSQCHIDLPKAALEKLAVNVAWTQLTLSFDHFLWSEIISL